MNEAQRKNILYSLALIAAMALVWWIRNPKTEQGNLQKVELAGATMGTTYQVKYLCSEAVNYQKSIDSLLEDINLCLSTYLPESEISKFNRSTLHKYERPYFYNMLQQSQEIYKATHGAYDPTVMQLVTAWGFGPEKSQIPDQKKVDSLLATVSFDSIYFDELAVCKLHENTQLDFSAIAKGYAADVITSFLRDKQLTNTFVEIGGEISAQGTNEEGQPWAVYIERPDEGQRSVQALVSLNNLAIATSGNYRNFYVKDGKKYAHTISPFTGYPVQHNLLSASVFASNCATADAYATAFMVMGMEEALKVVAANDDLEAYFIYNDSKGAVQTKATPGIKKAIIE